MPADPRLKDPATLLCERCGYIIEGLDQAGVCPECAKPIAESLPGRRTWTPYQQNPSIATLLITWWTTIRWPFHTIRSMSAGDSAARSHGLLTVFVTGLICSPLLLAPAVHIGLSSGPGDDWSHLIMMSYLVLVFAEYITYLVLIGLLSVPFAVAKFGKHGRRRMNFRAAITGHASVWLSLAFVLFSLTVAVSYFVRELCQDSDPYRHSLHNATVDRLAEIIFFAGLGCSAVSVLVAYAFCGYAFYRLRYANTPTLYL